MSSSTDQTHIKTDLSKIIASIEKNRETNAISVFIPSLQQELQFKEISAKQRSELFGAMTDISMGRTLFNYTFSKILQENILDSSMFTKLKICDRAAIAIAYRINEYGDIYKFVDADGSNPVPINLSEYQNKLNNIDTEIYLKTSTFNIDGVEIQIKAPSIYREFLVDEKYKDQRITRDSEKSLEQIGELFIWELVKYIHEIKIENVDIILTDEIFCDYYDDISTIVKSLGAGIRNILKTIDELVTMVSNSILVEKDGIDYSLDIDAMFLLKE